MHNNNINIYYEAFFIKDISLNGVLANDIDNKHITTAFMPEVRYPELYGKTARFKVVGYANDETNEGYKVELVSVEDERLRALYEDIPVPHITLSISDDGQAKDTCDLKFENTTPFFIDAVFGICENDVVSFCVD